MEKIFHEKQVSTKYFMGKRTLIFAILQNNLWQPYNNSELSKMYSQKWLTKKPKSEQQ